MFQARDVNLYIVEACVYPLKDYSKQEYRRNNYSGGEYRQPQDGAKIFIPDSGRGQFRTTAKTSARLPKINTKLPALPKIEVKKFEVKQPFEIPRAPKASSIRGPKPPTLKTVEEQSPKTQTFPYADATKPLDTSLKRHAANPSTPPKPERPSSPEARNSHNVTIKPRATHSTKKTATGKKTPKVKPPISSENLNRLKTSLKKTAGENFNIPVHKLKEIKSPDDLLHNAKLIFEHVPPPVIIIGALIVVVVVTLLLSFFPFWLFVGGAIAVSMFLKKKRNA